MASDTETERLEWELETKIHFLDNISEELEELLVRNELDQAQMQLKVYESTIAEIRELRWCMQRLKFEGGVDPESFRMWDKRLQKTIGVFESVVVRIRKVFTDMNHGGDIEEANEASVSKGEQEKGSELIKLRGRIRRKRKRNKISRSGRFSNIRNFSTKVMRA